MQQILEFAGNHPLLVAALGATIVFIFVNEMRVRSGIKAITAHDAVRKINDSSAVIIDVRESSEFKSGHIVNARNIPVARLAADVETQIRDKSKPIIVYCRTGNRSNEAGKKLIASGYQDVSQLKSGILGWQEANLPVEK